MLTSETKRRINNCRDILVGKLPQPSNQVELITLALIYKFMDDLDEESVRLGGKRSFFTGALADYRWRALLPQTVSADERMTRFARGIELLGGADMEVKGKRSVPGAHLPGLFRDIFRNAFLKFRDGRILTMFLTEVNGFAYSHSEELGNAFEYLLQCTGAQGENGQFRTPRHIIDFIVACLDPQPGDRILDPACGTGGFLVSAYRHILAQHTSSLEPRSSGRESAPIKASQKSEPTHVGCYSSVVQSASIIPGDLLTHAQRQAVYKNLAGYDVDDQMVKLSKVNLFLHGFPDPAIHIYDSLSNDARWHEKADLILAKAWFDCIKSNRSFAVESSIQSSLIPKSEILERRGTPLSVESVANQVALESSFPQKNIRDLCDNFAGLWKAPEGAKNVVICSVVRNTNFTKDCRLDLSDVAVLEVEEKKLQSRSLLPGDIILEKSGGGPKQPVGRVVLFPGANGNWSFSNFCSLLRLKPDSGIESTFFYWCLRHRYLQGDTEDLQNQTSGIRNLDLEAYLDLEIPLPPLEEQRRIVGEIVGYQKVLDGARQILAGYRAKIPDQDEWPIVELRELIEGKPKNGYSGKPVQHATSLKVLTLTATTSGKMDITKFKYLDEHISKDSPCRCRRGDIYLQRGNTKELVGTAALLNVDVPDLIYPDLMIRVRADETKILTTFLLHTLQSQPVREYLMRNAGGAAGNMPKINQGIVESIPIPLPPLPEQRRIVSELDAEAAQMEAVRALLPRFEAKIQRVLARVWGNGTEIAT